MMTIALVVAGIVLLGLAILGFAQGTDYFVGPIVGVVCLLLSVGCLMFARKTYNTKRATSGSSSLAVTK